MQIDVYKRGHMWMWGTHHGMHMQLYKIDVSANSKILTSVSQFYIRILSVCITSAKRFALQQRVVQYDFELYSMILSCTV